MTMLEQDLEKKEPVVNEPPAPVADPKAQEEVPIDGADSQIDVGERDSKITVEQMAEVAKARSAPEGEEKKEEQPAVSVEDSTPAVDNSENADSEQRTGIVGAEAPADQDTEKDHYRRTGPGECSPVVLPVQICCLIRWNVNGLRQSCSFL